MAPLPIADRIRMALKLEPMSCRELAKCLCVDKGEIMESVWILQARGAIHQLSNGVGWINQPRKVMKSCA